MIRLRRSMASFRLGTESINEGQVWTNAHRLRPGFQAGAPLPSAAFGRACSPPTSNLRQTRTPTQWPQAHQPAAWAICLSYTTVRVLFTACKKYGFRMKRGFTRSTGRPNNFSNPSARLVQRRAREPPAWLSSSTKKSKSLDSGLKPDPVAEPNNSRCATPNCEHSAAISGILLVNRAFIARLSNKALSERNGAFDASPPPRSASSTTQVLCLGIPVEYPIRYNFSRTIQQTANSVEGLGGVNDKRALSAF